MNIADCFMRCSANLLVRKQDAVEQRQQTLMRSLNKVFWQETPRIDYSFFFGSYGRNAACRETAVLDVLFVLPDESFQQLRTGDAEVLNKFRSATAALFLDAKCVLESAQVALTFRDDIHFRVYPARLERNGTYSFYHPELGEVKGYDLRGEMAAFHEMNKQTNSNLMHLGRLLRAWRSKASLQTHSLALDALAYDFIRNWEQRDRSFMYYDFMCRDFFTYLATRATNNPSITVPGSKFSMNIPTQLVAAASAAAVLANEAIDEDKKTQTRRARLCWHQIFGEYFPT